MEVLLVLPLETDLQSASIRAAPDMLACRCKQTQTVACFRPAAAHALLYELTPD